MDIMDSIQECTGRVLNEIARSGRVNILSLAGHLGERSLIVHQSIGWLAREGNQVCVMDLVDERQASGPASSG